jgi:hypothetical protein
MRRNDGISFPSRFAEPLILYQALSGLKWPKIRDISSAHLAWVTLGWHLAPMTHVRQLSKARSAVENGSRLHVRGVDGRSASARRFRDLYQGFCRDLGDDPSESDKALARTAAALATNGEFLQARLAAGEAVDPDALVRNANGLARAVSALKAKAKPRDAVPSLADYLRQNYPAPASGEAPGGHLAAADDKGAA